MSHEVETMAWRNEVPWHGLGHRVDGDISIEEWLKVAGLDWRVNCRPMKAELEDGSLITVPDKFALVRDSDNEVFMVCSGSWKPLQNADTIGFMRNYVNAGGASLETAGSLRNGKIVWGLAKLNHSFSVGRGDKVEGYLLITSPHIVGNAISIRTTTVRVVCANTMAMAESEGTINYKQNHLTEFNVEAAKAAVAKAHEHLGRAERNAKKIAKLKITLPDALTKVLLPVYEPEFDVGSVDPSKLLDPDVMPKRIAEIVQAIQTGPGATEGNGWGVMNGVTFWSDHVQGRTNASRLYRSWVGDYSRKKTEVEQKLLELAA